MSNNTNNYLDALDVVFDSLGSNILNKMYSKEQLTIGDIMVATFDSMMNVFDFLLIPEFINKYFDYDVGPFDQIFNKISMNGQIYDLEDDYI